MESRFPIAPDNLAIIASNASLYDWLVGLTRKQPDYLPPPLYADFGLPRPDARDPRADWRAPRHRDG